MPDSADITSLTSRQRLSAFIESFVAAKALLQEETGPEIDAVVDTKGRTHLLGVAENALQQSEKRFRALIEKGTDMIGCLAADGTILYQSPSVESALGYAPEALVGRNLFDFIDPVDQVRLRATWDRLILKAGNSVRDLFRFRHQDGSCRWVEGTGTNLLDDRSVEAIVLNYRDVTERKRSEERLESSELRYRTMLQGLEAGVIVHGADGRVTVFNAKALELLGATEQQMFRRDPREAIWRRVRQDGSPLAEAELPFMRALTSRQPVREAILGLHRPDRRDLQWMMVNANPVLTAAGEVAEVIVTFMDVTARVVAEKALTESVQFTGDILNSLSAHVVVLDEQGTILTVNEAWRRFARENGITATDYLGHNYLAACRIGAGQEYGEDAREVVAGIRGVLTGQSPLFMFDYPCHSPEVERWFHMRVTPLSGARRGVVVSHQDVTARKQNELALRESEIRYKALFEQAAMGVSQIEVKSGRFVRVNQRFADIVGYSVEQLCRRSFAAITHPDDLDVDLEPLRQLQAGTIREFTCEKRYLRQDGTPVWVNLTVSAMWAPGATPDYFTTVVQDITERKQLEEQFRHSQKMEAMGRLSAGVAHDFNNLLTVIMGRIGLLRMKDKISPDIAASIHQIDEAAERATKLTRQLLTFSRQENTHLKEHNLNGLLANMVKMLRRLVVENISIQVAYSRQTMRIKADEGMVEQVLLNLVVNARDAMPKGGTIQISTAPVDLDESAQTLHPAARAGAFVCLTVSDTGTGIAPEVVSRIFDPYFTTKGVGKGTGLGLATVYGVMQQHDGWIEVESVLGAGTTFRAYWPRLAAAGEMAVDGKSAVVKLPGGHETILLVEDEQAVRVVSEAALVSLGYRVVIAPSGQFALQLWQEHKHDIDLLVTDLVMPDRLSGRELALRLRAEKPHLPILYMSGYPQGEITEGFSLTAGINYLTKPFDLATLANMVRSSLDRGATATPFGSPAGGPEQP